MQNKFGNDIFFMHLRPLDDMLRGLVHVAWNIVLFFFLSLCVWRLLYNFQIVAGFHGYHSDLIHVDLQYSHHSNDDSHCQGCSRWT